MRKWEYQVIRASPNVTFDVLVSNMNRDGDAGWELVSVVPVRSMLDFQLSGRREYPEEKALLFYYFRREIE